MKNRCRPNRERALLAEGYRRVCGIDEAGRGPLAGPVIAAAVVLPARYRLNGLNDSKQLGAAQRLCLFRSLTNDRRISFAVGGASVAEIDQINILQASHLAMQRAIDGLAQPPDYLLVDGLPVKSLVLPQQAIIDGDALSTSIAAASIIAKVTRDIIMSRWHARFPVYQFFQHKGYGTRVHLDLLQIHGPCPLHRRTFSPVAADVPVEPG